MARGTITVSNFSEKSMNVQIQSIVPGKVGDIVTSGTLASGQTSGFLVSGSQQFQVNFSTTDKSGNVTASNVAPNSLVQLAINGE
jgi:hypothetical protein